ncbi:MAG TPA: hypothetical protein VGF97_15390 [Rhizomicrobium sp.]|jgi:hypothetical protein
MRSTSISVLVCAGLLVCATQAGAEDLASMSGCVKRADQVTAALAGDQHAATYGAALKEKGYGRDFCLNGMYRQGVAHYDEALRLLDTQKS